MRIGTGFQVGAVSIEYPSTYQPSGDGLLNNIIKNLLEDLAVIETAAMVLASGAKHQVLSREHKNLWSPSFLQHSF
ncbi:hypothetical protein B738_23865 [Photorhabdus temperata subsp. temperata M1021]|nr:hypothetical protein B738_23865 [Photorhabdus temperata subsp. temperata M1021]